MPKLRVLWVPYTERELVSGGEYEDDDVRKRGYDPEGMVRDGEAEWVSPPKPEPAAAPKAPKKKK